MRRAVKIRKLTKLKHFPITRLIRLIRLAVWLSGNALASINVVALCHSRLVVVVVVVVVVVEIFIHGAVKATVTNAPQSQLNK